MNELSEKQNIVMFRNIFFTILAVSTNQNFQREPPSEEEELRELEWWCWWGGKGAKGGGSEME